MRKEKKKHGWLFPMFIIFIMVFSVFEIMLSGSSDTTNYNGYKVKTLQDGFETKAGKTTITTMYHPKQLESINAPSVNALDMMGKQTALTFDPEQENQMYSDYARFELEKFLNNIQVPTASAVTKGGEYNLPIINCENATDNLIVVVFEQSNETKITKDGNCYTLTGASPQEIIMAEDRFKLTIAGVMNSTQ